MTLLTRIKVLCAEHNTTLSSLEKALGFGNGTISKWDNATPSGDRLSKVADYFGISVDFLLGREKDEKTESEAIRKVKILTRRTDEYLTPEEQEILIKHYEDSINLYLRAKGIKIDK